MSQAAIPIHWDHEADFISIGSGIGGLSGAICADAWGLKAIVLEKSATIGGVTAYSAGQLWVPANHLANNDDSIAEGLGYIRAIAAGLADERLATNYLVNARAALEWFDREAGIPFEVITTFPDYHYPHASGSRPEGRYIEVRAFEGSSLGEWQGRVQTSPQVRSGMTTTEVLEVGGPIALARLDPSLLNQRIAGDVRTHGPGLAASFGHAAIRRDVQIETNADVRELIVQDDRVVGVRVDLDGRDTFWRARKGVLIAAGAYDWDEVAQKAFSMMPDVRAVGPETVTGDAIKLAGRIGARLSQVPQTLSTGFEVGSGADPARPRWRLGSGVLGVPHSIAVNREGRRFAEESFYPAVGYAIKIIDGSTMRFANLPFWAIQDSQARSQYAVGPFGPGQELPESVAFKANTIRELAEIAGIDPDGLVSEVERFNNFVDRGVDDDFHRGERPWAAISVGDLLTEGNSNLGKIEVGPFYAIRMIPVNIGISSMGLVGDEHNRVMDWDNHPIEGLYVTGNSMALLEFGAGYNSGQANTRGMLGGYLAARHAAGDPSPALEAYEKSVGA